EALAAAVYSGRLVDDGRFAVGAHWPSGAFLRPAGRHRSAVSTAVGLAGGLLHGLRMRDRRTAVRADRFRHRFSSLETRFPSCMRRTRPVEIGRAHV